jgi:hypothetical protein
MTDDLLPRGDVREFENWLIREVNFRHLHYHRLESVGKGDTVSGWTAHAELCTAVNILARYTDLDPNDIHKVARNYREVKRVIHEGSSHWKAIEKQVEAQMRKEEE